MNRIRLIHVDTLSCEPILRRTPNGELLCICQCGDVREPAAGNREYCFRSRDNGETWSEPVSIYPEIGKAVYATEVMVHNGVITVFVTTHSGRFLDWDCVMVKSYDNGYTWEIAGTPPYFDRFTFIRSMIQTKSGRLLLPYQHYPITAEENARVAQSDLEDKAVWETRAPYVENGVLSSDDNGVTYQKYVSCHMDLQNGWIWSEPTIAELSDGTIVMLLRWCGSGCLWRTDSRDGGKTWGELVRTDIPNPSNKPKLIPMDRGRIALIHTPSVDKRYPLQIWISDDDMRTWSRKEMVTEFPGSYSYADGFYENGHIQFTIEYNRHDILFIDHTLE